jgi:hypothetical protein
MFEFENAQTVYLIGCVGTLLDPLLLVNTPVYVFKLKTIHLRNPLSN